MNKQKHLIRWLKLKGDALSYAEIERQAGLSQGMITKYISGDRSPRMTTYIKLLAVVRKLGYKPVN